MALTPKVPSIKSGGKRPRSDFVQDRGKKRHRIRWVISKLNYLQHKSPDHDQDDKTDEQRLCVTNKIQ